MLQKEFNTDELDFYLAPLRDQWLETENPPGEDGKKTDAPTGPQGALTNAAKKFWVEKTIVKGRPDRESGPHRVGAALWSPQKSSDGKDIYANMREVSPGDVVLHLTDNSGFSGVSVAADRVDENFGGIAGTVWGEQASYMVQLNDFQALDPPLSREVLFSTMRGPAMAFWRS